MADEGDAPESRYANALISLDLAIKKAAQLISEKQGTWLVTSEWVCAGF